MPGEIKKGRSSPKCSQEDVSCADLNPDAFDEVTRITLT